jgi:hypothetical protein
MNDVSEYSTVIEKLLDRTRNGKVSWEVVTYGFRAVVKSYEFRISKSEDRGDVTISLGMFDSTGNEIFEARLTDDPQTLSKYSRLVSGLQELHELARRGALNVEEKINEVSTLLDEM